MKKMSAPQNASTHLDRGPNEGGTDLTGRSLFGCVCRLLPAVLIGLSMAPQTRANEIGSDAPNCSLAEPIAELARDGDLIFRRGGSFESRVVLQLDRLGYSHVGLVQSTPRGLVVIHSLPRRGHGLGGYVEETPLAEFLAPGRADAAALFRVASGIPKSVPMAAARWAQAHVRRATPFDSEFDATTPEALYCTELIWAAYRATGVDLLPQFVPRSGSVRSAGYMYIFRALGHSDNDLILPSDLAQSPQVEAIATVDAEASTCRTSVAYTAKNEREGSS